MLPESRTRVPDQEIAPQVTFTAVQTLTPRPSPPQELVAGQTSGVEPKVALIHANLGLVLKGKGQLDEAFVATARRFGSVNRCLPTACRTPDSSAKSAASRSSRTGKPGHGRCPHGVPEAQRELQSERPSSVAAGSRGPAPGAGKTSNRSHGLPT